MLAGRRIMFAYGVGGDFFAHVKPELLPADTWQSKNEICSVNSLPWLHPSATSCPTRAFRHDA
jgi:hypothetical protein